MTYFRACIPSFLQAISDAIPGHRADCLVPVVISPGPSEYYTDVGALPSSWSAVEETFTLILRLRQSLVQSTFPHPPDIGRFSCQISLFRVRANLQQICVARTQAAKVSDGSPVRRCCVTDFQYCLGPSPSWLYSHGNILSVRNEDRQKHDYKQLTGSLRIHHDINMQRKLVGPEP
ncbi:hypothetical protein IF1G_03045 [Cordyceps javanica]|uniref:Uncharacterized protein n=1 Tax=Cordyceps javanica TaxID=43265 RepID=A0A545VB55_9HYPO|nr:hypothetical protein IF1G_03045 [Cordyceps javanica]